MMRMQRAKWMWYNEKMPDKRPVKREPLGREGGKKTRKKWLEVVMKDLTEV